MLTQLKHNKWYLLACTVACYMIYVIYLRNHQGSLMIFPVAASMMALITFLPIKKELASFVVLLLSGVSFALITPVLYSPDEYVHLSRAMHIAQGDINLDNKPEHLLISEDYFVIIDDYTMPPLAVEAFDRHASENKVPFNGLADFRTTNAYWFFGYLPQVTGILIGRTLGLNIGATYYLGRILNAICYAFLAYLAIKLSGAYKQVMMLITLMPMNLYLASTYNQDGLALGLIYVVCGLFIHYLNREKRIEAKELALYTTLCCSLATLKLPYILLIGLLFFVPKERFAFKKPYRVLLGAATLVFVVAAIWFIGYQQITSNITLEGVGVGEQIHSILRSPFRSVLALSKEFFLTPHRLVMLFYFGFLTLPMRETLIPISIFYLTVIACNLGRGNKKLISRIGSLLISLSIICGIILVMYLTWTTIGKSSVDGIQGRYYLGVFPLILFAITSWPIHSFTPPRLSNEFVLKGSIIVITMVLTFIILSTY